MKSTIWKKLEQRDRVVRPEPPRKVRRKQPARLDKEVEVLDRQRREGTDRPWKMR